MAAFEADDITKVFQAPNGSGGAVLPVAETATGGMANLKLGCWEDDRPWWSAPPMVDCGITRSSRMCGGSDPGCDGRRR